MQHSNTKLGGEKEILNEFMSTDNCDSWELRANQPRYYRQAKLEDLGEFDPKNSEHGELPQLHDAPSGWLQIRDASKKFIIECERYSIVKVIYKDKSFRAVIHSVLLEDANRDSDDITKCILIN